jgi:acyl carrier protein
MEYTGTDVSVPAVRDWLVDRVAFYLERPADQVDPATLFVELGLDSVYALTLCGDIEEQYAVAVDSTLPWDYPSVDALAAHLSELLSAR